MPPFTMLPSPSPARKRQKLLDGRSIQAVLGPDSESDSSESDSSVAPGSISPSVVIQREFLCSEQLQGNVKASTETAYNAPLTPNAPSSPPRARTVKPENGVLVTYESGPEDAPTLSTVLIKPPGKVLKDIYTYSSPQRNIRWRNDKNRHSNSHHGQVSIALQALGISQFPPCTCCAAGQGPFEVCVAFRGICDDRIVSKGACANCVWTGHAAICSFHPAHSMPSRTQPRKSVGARRSSKRLMKNEDSILLDQPGADQTMTEPDEQQLNPAQTDVQDSTIGLNRIQEAVIVDDVQPANMEIEDAGQDNAERENAMKIEEEQNNGQQIVVTMDEEKETQNENREIDAVEQNDGAETEENSDSMYLSQEAPISEQLTAFQNTPNSSPCPPSPQHQDQTLYFPKDPAAADTQSQEEKPDPDQNPASEFEPKPNTENERELETTLNLDTSFTSFASCRSLNSTLNRPGHGTPPECREHEYVFFPTGIHPRDDKAIEKALGEAQKIARRLERRLVALRSESWDDV